jgi:2-phospho-L-lactate/phosphoenolpyruvate guanylyltransferase
MHVLAVPVKPLARSKTRLASALSPDERAALTLAMLEDVLDACLTVPGWETWVVSRSPEVLAIATQRGARGLPERGSSLRQAIRQTETELAQGDAVDGSAEVHQLAVVLADLPLITTRALSNALALPGDVVAAPAESDGGTNLLLRRPATAMAARFGRSSFERHRAEAYGRGLTFTEARIAELGFDLDRPADLVTLLSAHTSSRARSACRDMGLAERLRIGA